MAQLRGATQRLTHIGLVLTHPRGRGEWLVRLLTLLFGLAIGMAAALVGTGWQPGRDAVSAAAAAAQHQQREQQLQQQLDQSRDNLRLSEARSVELERQIASLIQQLRESQEELTFFRKARDAKR